MWGSVDGDWALYHTPEGHPYYFNHISGESRWAEVENLVDSDPQTHREEVEGSSSSSESWSSSESADSSSSFEELLLSDEGWELFEREQEHIAKSLRVDTGLEIYNVFDTAWHWLLAAQPTEEDRLNSYDFFEDHSEVSSSDSDIQELRAPYIPAPVLSLTSRLIDRSYAILLPFVRTVWEMLRRNRIFASVQSLISTTLSRKTPRGSSDFQDSI